MNRTSLASLRPLRAPKSSYFSRLKKNICQYYELYLLILPVIIYFIVFCYYPMYGAQIAFRKYKPRLGILGSDWVGLKHFISYFNSFYFWRLIRNTVLLNIYGILFHFPLPIVLALMINELRSRRYKRIVQTVTYLPHFVSLVVICALLSDMLSVNGWFNDLIEMLGGERRSFLIEPGSFRTIHVTSNIYQQVGWNSIVYLAAISAIDPQLYEAAIIDGAGRFQRIFHVTIPSIAPTIITLFIMRLGSMMNIGHEKVLLLYNEATYETADVISTFVYRKGLLDADYSYSTAVGLVNSVVNFGILVLANTISKRVSETSLW